MKHVGIITFHDVLNYGASLQAFALSTALKSWGYDVEIINYLNPKMRDERTLLYPFKHSTNPADKVISLMRIRERKKMQAVFDEFCNSKLPLSGPRISSKEELTKVSSRYDAVITGSDQVFNYKGTGEDFAFYLDPIPSDIRRIAYAPSFGLREIDEVHRRHVTQSLNNFDALSAREDCGADIIRKLTGSCPKVVVDPTFLLDKQQWLNLSSFLDKKESYVLIYSFGSTELEDVAWEKAKTFGCKVLNINRVMPDFSGKTTRVVSPSPEEFIGLIANANYVVTNSFHGMALSIILHKQFTAYVNDYEGASETNPRFFSLAKRLKLENQIRPKGQPISDCVVNYDTVSNILDIWKKESKSFLEKAING